MLEPSATVGTVIKTANYLKTAKDFWNRLQPTLQSKIRVKIEKHFTNFEDYLDRTNGKTSTVQLICSRSINSELNDVYVPCSFHVKDAQSASIDDHSLISDIRDGKRVVVRGDGGSGKTLFMKKLWKSVYEEPEGKIPVFIELRKFNDMEDVDILTLMRYTLSAGKEMKLDLFREIAADGSFLLIFDGFDEVSLEKREAVERQLLEFEQYFKKCSIVISSRPNETFVGWKAFQIYDVNPFTRAQTLDLISKTPLPKDLTNRFKNMITKKFFKRYEEFLSSPLLALMMLVTYRQKADIADNIIDFYDNAFHALYSEHDAIKESYKRPHCLSINEFRLVFSTFCMFTYYQEKFELREAEIREYIQRSIDHVNLTKDGPDKITCTIDQFMHEVIDAVNLIKKDGMSYLFIHRSFQEFFAAYWVINIDFNRTEKILEDFAMRASDNVLNLAYRMNKVKVDQAYIMPFYDRLIEAEMIFKIKPAGSRRWAYIEGYNLKPIWRVIKVKKPKSQDEFVPILYPTWDNGEVGKYYTNLDNLVFQGALVKKFTDCMTKCLSTARPTQLLKHGTKSPEYGTKLSASVKDGEITLCLHDPRTQNTTDVTEAYLGEDPKYHKKIEAAFDEIDTMLHEINKMVNLHISKSKDGHSKSEKSLDDMFF